MEAEDVCSCKLMNCPSQKQKILLGKHAHFIPHRSCRSPKRAGFLYLYSLFEDCRALSRLSFSLFLLFVLLSTTYGVPSENRGRRILPDRESKHFQEVGGRFQKKPDVYLNEFAVNIVSGGDTKARELALKYGFVFKGQIASLDGWYLFEDKRIYKRSLRNDRFHASSYMLMQDKDVNIVEQLKLLNRKKRGRVSISSGDINSPNDPAWERMWYMHCGGADNNVCPTSMRISDTWRAGYFGSGVVVTILDDGIEADHPDLRLNYDGNASYDINDNDKNPTPRYDHSNENKHGTRCAGVVAAVSDNHICSVGIAYKAKIGGVRMLDGEVTDHVEAKSLEFNNQHIDIYSASWGPDDDGGTVEGPGYLAKAAFKDGARNGRAGKGSIFVWASGNGGHNKDTCSCDGYINSIYTIGISSVSQNGKRPWYLESCASTLATTYSSGEVHEGKVITTDLRGTCTYAHTGTSASAPMAAGVIALMLDANQNLTWRDVQHIIVRTSNPYGLQANDWLMNAAGFNVSHVFGFGLMDAARLTYVASKWKTVPEQRQCISRVYRHQKGRTIIPDDSIFLFVESSGCKGEDNEIRFLEHVILRITLTHSRRGDLQIFLTSPAGTKSNILERRSLDRSSAGFDEWDFMTTHHWGERPNGTWTLEILDAPFRLRYRDHSQTNAVKKWHLIFYGTYENPQTNFSYNSCDAFPQDQCHPECEGCCGPTDMECRTCKHVSTFTGKCIASCPSGQFAHPHTRTCQPCWKTCQECSAAWESNCTACDLGFSLDSGRCVKTCIQGYYLDQVSQRCRRCDHACRACEVRSNRCTSCRQGFEHRDHTCHPSCQPGTFLLSFRDGCQFCHTSCAECTGPTNLHCTSCAPGLILHKRRCVASCPRRYYFDSNRPKHSCKPCHNSCKTCNGHSSSHCTSCGTDFDLRNGQCKQICRDGYRGNYRSYPCLLVIQMKFCSVEIFHRVCCHTCSQYENGALFTPSTKDILNSFSFEEDANYTDIDDDDYEYVYDDDYSEEDSVSGTGQDIVSTSSDSNSLNDHSDSPDVSNKQVEPETVESHDRSPLVQADQPPILNDQAGDGFRIEDEGDSTEQVTNEDHSKVLTSRRRKNPIHKAPEGHSEPATSNSEP